jgi:hypothetical protein
MATTTAVARRLRHPEAIAVAGLIAVAWFVRIVIGAEVPSPSVYIDELVHAELARNLLAGEWFRVRGEHVGISYLYPVLIAPAWLLHSSEQAYAVAKAIGALVMVSTAVPVYLWSRRLMTSRLAVVAVGLALLVPAFSLTSALMLETLFLPIFVLGLFAVAATLERPSLRNQGLTLLVIVAASLTRFQGLILVPIVVTGIAVYWIATRCPLRPLAPILLAIGGGFAVYAAWRLLAGLPLIPSSSIYESFSRSPHTVTGTVSWLHANAAALVFATAFVPCFALVLVSLGVLVHRERDRAVCAYVTVTLAAVAWLLAFAAYSATWEPAGLKERYTFYVEPVVLMALPLWLSRGARRGRLTGAVVALALTALVVTIPLEKIISAPALLQSYSFLGLSSWSHAHGVDTVLTLVSVWTAVLAVVVVLAPRPVLVWLLPAAVVATLAVNSWYAITSLSDRGRGTDSLAGLRADRDFVDDAVSRRARVYYLNTTTYQIESARGQFWETWAPVWTAEFWNRSLRGTISFGLGESSPLRQGSAALDWATGRISATAAGPWRSSLALTDPRFRLVGQELRREGPFVLTRFRQPLRLRSAVEGVDAGGTTLSGAAYDVYDSRSRRARVTFQSPYPLDVRLRSGALGVDGNAPVLGQVFEETQTRIPAGAPHSVLIRVPPAPYRVEVHTVSGAPVKVDFGQG